MISLFFSFLGWLLGPLAIAFGVKGRRRAKGGAPSIGLANWGLGLGIVGTFLGLGFLLFIFVAASCECL